MLEFKGSDRPISYLGLPLEGNPKASDFWDPMIDIILYILGG